MRDVFFQRRSSLSLAELEESRSIIELYFEVYVVNTFNSLFSIAIEDNQMEEIEKVLDPLVNLTEEECIKHAENFYREKEAQVLISYFHKLLMGKLTLNDNLIQTLRKTHPFISLEKANKLISEVITIRTTEFKNSLRQASSSLKC